MEEAAARGPRPRQGDDGGPGAHGLWTVVWSVAVVVGRIGVLTERASAGAHEVEVGAAPVRENEAVRVVNEGLVQHLVVGEHRVEEQFHLCPRTRHRVAAAKAGSAEWGPLAEIPLRNIVRHVLVDPHERQAASAKRLVTDIAERILIRPARELVERTIAIAGNPELKSSATAAARPADIVVLDLVVEHVHLDVRGEQFDRAGDAVRGIGYSPEVNQGFTW